MEALLKTIDTTFGDPSFWIGIVVVFVFACERFGQKRSDLEEFDLPVPVRSFTTRFRYNFAALAYGGTYSAIYVGLICLGAFPDVQALLKEWLGAIGAGGIEESHTIATPLGAAVVTISLVPSIPLLRRWDTTLRATLRDFASIPLKARYMSDMLLDDLSRQVRARHGTEPDSTTAHLIREKLALYDEVRERIRHLQRLRRLKAARRYNAFFQSYGQFAETLDEAMDTIRREIATGSCDSHFVLGQIDENTNRLARYLVCSLLAVETDEYSALKTMSDELGLRNIRATTWRFKSSQIFLGVVVVFVCALLGSLVGAFTLRYLAVEAYEGILGSLFLVCVMISLSLVPIFLMPLVFAAGAKMYMIDRVTFGERLEWDDRTLAVVLTFLGCLGSALLVTLVFGVLASRLEGAPIEIAPILPWAFPPAAVALTFFLLSRTHASRHRPANTAIDFVVHALVAIVAGLVAQRLSLLFGLTYQGDPVLDLLIYAVTEPLPIAVVMGLIGGVLGALQCAVSREVITPSDDGLAPDVRSDASPGMFGDGAIRDGSGLKAGAHR